LFLRTVRGEKVAGDEAGDDTNRLLGDARPDVAARATNDSNECGGAELAASFKFAAES
jgi:hypothetical protein